VHVVRAWMQRRADGMVVKEDEPNDNRPSVRRLAPFTLDELVSTGSSPLWSNHIVCRNNRLCPRAIGRVDPND
jgi:hypothetical protein